LKTEELFKAQVSCSASRLAVSTTVGYVAKVFVYKCKYSAQWRAGVGLRER